MIPVNAFSILKMVSKHWVTVCLLGCLVWGAVHVFAFPSRKSPCDRILRQYAKKLAERADYIQQQAVDSFDSLLFIQNFAYEDTTIESMRMHTRLQSALVPMIVDAAEQPGNTCGTQACLLLVESFFYQQDYDNVRKYLRCFQQRNDDKLTAEAAVWLMRVEFAERRWSELSSLLETYAYLKKTDTLTGLSLDYALLEADYKLCHSEDEERLQALCDLEAHAFLSPSLQTRLQFIKGQLLLSVSKEREAIPCFSYVTSHSKGEDAMHAYAYVFRDACRRSLAQRVADSLQHALELQANRLPFEPTMVESCHDSAFIYSIYPYYFQDLASRFFFDEECGETAGNMDAEDTVETGTDLSWYDDNDTSGISPEMLSAVFENWDSVSIHIPKADFSNLTDTIFLPLVDRGYQMPPFTQVISEFGWRRYRYHYGVDTRNKMGDTIRCLFDGKVRIVKRSRTYGNVIVVRHLNGLETFYAHCSRILAVPNQNVCAGEVIALVGSTGRSTGPHLHFETRYKGVPFNPRHIINFDTNCLWSDTLKITRETFNYMKPYGGSGTSSASGAVYYKIKPGDTLSQIARKYHTSVAAIKRLNGMRSDFIRDGKRIRVR